MKTHKIVVVILAIALCLTGCTAQNGQTAPEKDPVDSKVSSGTSTVAFGASQPENAGTSSTVTDNTQSESAVSQSASVSASESMALQSETIGKQISWADKACAPVTFAEDPAGCISYAMWVRLEEDLKYISSREISHEKKQERIQTQLECPDPTLITSAGLTDLNRDGVPELFVFFLGGASNTPIRVYDISDESPTCIAEYTGGGQVIMDYVYNENGNEIARIITYFGSVRAPKEVVVTFEKQADGQWNVWKGRKEERVGVEEVYIDVFHGREQVDDPDGSLYNQLISYPASQPMAPYIELDDIPVYEETLSTGEDWWIAYGRMLWEQYQQALQQTSAAS